MRGIGIALFLLLAAAAPPENESPSPEPRRAVGSWSAQTSGVGTALNAVTFLDPSRGFVVGANGVILRTTSAGTTWSPQTGSGTVALNGVGLGSPDVGCAVGAGGKILQTLNASTGSPSVWNPVTTRDLLAAAAVDLQHGWVAGTGGDLRLTTNGTDWPVGNSNAPGSVNVHGLSFLNTLTEGFWVGEMGTVMKTTDGTSWNPTTAPGTTQTLNAVSFVKTSPVGNATGWVVGDMGALSRTTNSGNAWTPVSLGITDSFRGVFAGDSTHAWTVGDNSSIYATTNGTVWNQLGAPAPGINLNAVSLFKSGINWPGVAVGAGGAVFTTPDGATWNSGTSGVTGALRGAAMLSATRAVAVGDGGVLLKSTNGGSNWTRVSSNLTVANLNAVAFSTATDGWAAGSNGTLLKTINGGDSWTLETTGTTLALNDVKYGSATLALAVGAGGNIFKSADGGAKWALKTTPMGAPWITTDLASLAFGTPSRAVAVGVGGGMVATNDGGDNWQALTLGAPLTQDLASVSAVSPTLFVAAGGGAAAAISYDTTGGTWSATVLPVPPLAMLGTSFASYSRQGYGVGAGGQIVASRDGGSSWTAETSTVTAVLRGVSFPSQSIGWAVGDGGTILVRKGPPIPLLSFPPHIGTPYTWQPPIVDGFINPELTEKRRPDTGWNQSLQVTFADGTSQAPVVFQGLRHSGGNYLYLSFEVRVDTSFDDDDTVILLFRGDNATGSHTANDRRIIINPLSTGTGSPAGTIIAEGYSAPPPPSTPYLNHENGDPRQLTSYKWDTGTNAWVAIAASTEITCKVRSWNPDTGQVNKSWSVELKIPTVNTTYTDWINIQNDFLFSFYVLRVQTGGVVESSWPRDLALVTGTQDIVDAPMSAFDWGPAKLGTANDGEGVRIKVPSYQNIGVTTPSTPPGTLETHIHGTLENTFHVFVQNDSTSTDALGVQPTFRIANWGVQSGDPLSGAWHLVPANQSTVNPPAAATVPKKVGATPGEHEYTIKWLITDPTVRADYAAHDHQCILVTLDSASDVLFSERSSWTNMDYVPSSRFDRKASVSSVGYGLDGARNGMQRYFLLTTSERYDFDPGRTALDVVPPPDVKRDGQGERGKADHPYYSGENLQRARLLQIFPGLKAEKTQVSHLIWSIHANKETSRTVTIHGHTYPILEQATGFGYVARHGAAVDQWASGLSGAIVKRLNNNEYEVTVPANGSADMDSGLESIEGSTPCLLGLVLLISLALMITFFFLKKKP